MINTSKGRRVTVTVSFVLPPGAKVRDAVAYTEDAVRSWHGSLCPPGADLGDGTPADGDPMFDLDPDTVTVKRRLKVR